MERRISIGNYFRVKETQYVQPIMGTEQTGAVRRVVLLDRKRFLPVGSRFLKELRLNVAGTDVLSFYQSLNLEPPIPIYLVPSSSNLFVAGIEYVDSLVQQITNLNAGPQGNNFVDVLEPTAWV